MSAETFDPLAPAKLPPPPVKDVRATYALGVVPGVGPHVGFLMAVGAASFMLTPDVRRAHAWESPDAATGWARALPDESLLRLRDKQLHVYRVRAEAEAVVGSYRVQEPPTLAEAAEGGNDG